MSLHKRKFFLNIRSLQGEGQNSEKIDASSVESHSDFIPIKPIRQIHSYFNDKLKLFLKSPTENGDVIVSREKAGTFFHFNNKVRYTAWLKCKIEKSLCGHNHGENVYNPFSFHSFSPPMAYFFSYSLPVHHSKSCIILQLRLV